MYSFKVFISARAACYKQLKLQTEKIAGLLFRPEEYLVYLSISQSNDQFRSANSCRLKLVKITFVCQLHLNGNLLNLYHDIGTFFLHIYGPYIHCAHSHANSKQSHLLYSVTRGQAIASLIQQFSNVVKFCQNALSFMQRAKKQPLLLKFEYISGDEVEVL